MVFLSLSVHNNCYLYTVRRLRRNNCTSYVLSMYCFVVQEYGSPPAVPQARGPVYPPGTPVHQDYGNTPLGPVAESPARADHLYPPSYETPLHEPTYDDAYQVLACHTLVLKKRDEFVSECLSYRMEYFRSIRRASR